MFRTEYLVARQLQGVIGVSRKTFVSKGVWGLSSLYQMHATTINGKGFVSYEIGSEIFIFLGYLVKVVGLCCQGGKCN